MRYLALATDYDGTLAHDGVVGDDIIRALERLIHSGRSLILVTGRELPDLQSIFPRLELFERVVAENGALLYRPGTHEKRTLADRPPQRFLDSLKERGVTNVSVGDVIVATWHPHETQVMDAIRECGLELQIIFNKDAVMILPTGVNKMTGLCAALDDLKLSRHNVAGVGDAENDHAFLESCECSIAVANAIPSLKEKADLVTKAERGAGVVELIDHLIDNDLADLSARLAETSILIGQEDCSQVTLPVYGSNVLVCGPSGSGKSTLVTGLLERIMDLKYQICLVDPEGDYENLPGCRIVGDENQAPSIKHVKQALEEPGIQVIVNLVSVSASDRADYYASLIAEIQDLRIRTGRPHWLVIDEAHHVLPTGWAPSSPQLTAELSNVLLITVHPGHVSPIALSTVTTTIVVGSEPAVTLREFADAIHIPVREGALRDLDRGEALVWFRDENRIVPVLRVEPSRNEHQRHRRKYAEGALEEDRQFYFKGPRSEMNLKVQNLNTFLQLAEGVDQETWLFHLKRGDYSNWLRHSLKDGELASQIESVEHDDALSVPESRQRIRGLIQEKYTAPS